MPPTLFGVKVGYSLSDRDIASRGGNEFPEPLPPTQSRSPYGLNQVKGKYVKSLAVLAVLSLALSGCSGDVFGTEDPQTTGIGQGGETSEFSDETGGTGSEEDPTGGTSSGTGKGTGSTGSGGTGETGGADTGGTGGADTGGSGGSDTGGTGGETGGTGGADTGGTGGGPTQVCTPGESVCSDQDVETCDSDGLGWSVTKTCTYLCSETAGGFCYGSCIPDTMQCSPEGNVQKCDAQGRWIHNEFCDNVCSGGACTGSCSPGATQCSGDTAQTCNDQGSWDNTEVCDYVCDSGTGSCTGVCEPGTSDCLGDVPRTCNALGQWDAGSECPFVCTGAGNCTGVCEPSTTECSGAGTRTCGSDGLWGSVSACPTGPNEDFTCSAGVCGTTCKTGYDDCTSAPGCESDLTALGTCGSCGTDCNGDPAHAAPVCTESGCDFVCDEGWGDVDGEASTGCEADIFNDPENCGEPGKSCYGGTCALGVCEFEGIEELASWPTNGGVAAIAEDGGYLYVHQWGGDILKVKADGTEAALVLASDHHPSGLGSLVVEGGEVFWASDCGGRTGCTTASGVYKVGTGGSGETRLSTHVPYNIDVENGYVYWNDGIYDMGDFPTSGSRDFYRVPTTGGATTLVGTVTLSGTVYSYIRVIGDKVYFVRSAGTCNASFGCNYFYLYEFDVEPLAFSRVISGGISYGGEYNSPAGFSSTGPMPFTMSGDYVFWASPMVYNYSGNQRGAGTVIGRAPLTEDNPSQHNTLVTQDGDDGYGDALVADDGYVYYALDNAHLVRVGVNGGTPEELTPHAPRSLVQDSSYLYWATYSLGDGKTYILRLAK
jgi:hypothetical protein